MNLIPPSNFTPSNLDELNIPVLATLPSVKKIDKGYHLSQMFLEDINSYFLSQLEQHKYIMAKFNKKKSILLLTSILI